MYLKFLGLSASLVLSSLSTGLSHTSAPAPAHPTPTFDTPPPPGEVPYTTGFPLCKIPGYTAVPGNYTEVIERQSNSTLKECHDGCRIVWPLCKSIAFHKRYTECLFFDREVQCTQLYRENSSEFVHYDLECRVR
ncbi:hypothetical protein LOCC1_G006386 [Lachnellula occidentalis]|uniref:Apple domain-containing protein n=1 Tax=Lachnellula occidentalis TaxID=215460 RepID=A0A8H8U973_9HELO|nr:hypothetical protein LOCC1_G006386 [Lachnellula occidentalis]